MSGVAAVRYLLAHDASLLALVPAARIMAGALPLGITLPAISVTTVSDLTRLTVAMTESTRFVTERVQVDVLAGDYPAVKVILDRVRDALPGSLTALGGTVNGMACDSILPDTTGPDIFVDNPKIYTQSQDFMVRYSR